VTARLAGGAFLIVPVTLNGAGPFDFLVDTGTNTTLIDPQVATELGLDAVDRLVVQTAAGETVALRYRVGRLGVGNEEAEGAEVLAVPLPTLRSLDKNIRGILGMNFLQGFSFRLDYANRRIELYSQGELPVASSEKNAPVRLEDGALIVTVRTPVAALGEWRLVLDSGIATAVIPRDRIKQVAENAAFGESGFLEGAAANVQTNGGQAAGFAITVRNAQIGGLRLGWMPIIVLNDSEERVRGGTDGLLPAAIFKSVGFDRRRSVLFFATK
jgi:predicted aspartyl protease